MSNERGYVIVEEFKVPSSHSFKAERCLDPECKHIHVISYDESGIPISEASFTKEHLKHLLEMIDAP